ncbi:hypothetical protein BGZ94_002939 [Podila epigama]|nr:hypothetical protein BGZ94_002939 [Podila epigama]
MKYQEQFLWLPLMNGVISIPVIQKLKGCVSISRASGVMDFARTVILHWNGMYLVASDTSQTLAMLEAFEKQHALASWNLTDARAERP